MEQTLRTVGQIDPDGLQVLLQRRDAVRQGLARDTQRAQQAIAAINAKAGTNVITVDEAIKLGPRAAAVAPDALKTLQRVRQNWRMDLLDPATQQRAEEMLNSKVLDQYAASVPKTGLDRALDSQWVKRGLSGVLLGGLALAGTGDPGSAAAAGLAGTALGGSTLAKVNNVFREQALLSPRYHVNNLADQAIKSAQEGIAPWLTGSKLPEALNAWGQLASEGQQTLAQGGKVSMFSPLSQSSKAFMQATKVDNRVVDAQFAGQGLAALHAFDAFTKGLSGKLGDANRQVASFYEWIGRTSAFVQGKEQVLQSSLPYFADRVRQVAGDDAAQAVMDTRGYMDAGKLASILGDGVAGQARATLLGEWNRLLKMGDDAGTSLATRIHFDYRNTTNLDDLMGQVMLFHVFATRNLVYYPRFLAEHPWTSVIFTNWIKQSEEDRSKGRAPERFLGEVAAPQQFSNLLGAFFGQQGEIFYNPLQYVSIAQQLLPLARQIAKPQPGQTPVGALLEGQQNIGLGFAPGQRFVLDATGALGESDSRSYLTPAQPLNAGAALLQGSGVLPMGRPFGDRSQTLNFDVVQLAADKAIEWIRGQKPFDPATYAVQKRLREQPIEQGQLPFPGRQPSADAVQQAAQGAARESGVLSGLGYLGLNPGLKQFPTAEATVRQSQGPQPKPVDTHNAPSKLASAMRGMQTGQNQQRELQAMLSDDHVEETLLRLARSVNNPLLFSILDQMGAEVVRDDQGKIVDILKDDSELEPAVARQAITTWMKRAGSGLPVLGQTYSRIPNSPPKVANSNQRSVEDSALLDQWLHAGPTQRAQLLSNPETRAKLAQLLGYTPTK
jgi:hypothetical protein